MRKISLTILTGATIASSFLSAGNSIKSDDGNLHGYLRIHHIIDGTENYFDKSTGSTVGFGIGYGREIFSGFKVGVEAYGVMDSGLTDKDAHLKNIAYGQFMNREVGGDNLDYGVAWGGHISYKVKDIFKATVARTQFKSPMTKIQITHVPNLYEFARVDGKILGGNASLSYITKMAYGSRSMADFGLIGEKTGTAGMLLNGLYQSPATSPQITRGDYYSIKDTLASGTNDSKGMFVFGYEKRIKRFDFKIWDFMIDDIANNLFIEANYQIPFGKGNGMRLSGHLWNQDISNSSYKANYGGTLIGAEATVKWNKFMAKVAYETKDDGGLLNAWGANPGYTSSIFSRNEYRSDVDAYKATLVYKPIKNLKIMVSYADYGQSSMGNSQTDATERDIVIAYKPRKNISLKLFNADRTSEYNGVVVGGNRLQKTQNHTRLIMNYSF